MNEFEIIDVFFKKQALNRPEVVFGIGDDAACLHVPSGMDLLVSTDTLVAEVHFLQSWDAYDIAYKAVMVNVSDIAAMAAKPCCLSLALTLPTFEKQWITRFAKGLHASLAQFNIALIGGDMTHGPLSMTLTIHGLVPAGKAIKRSGAQVGDKIYLSGELGAAALAVFSLQEESVTLKDRRVLLQKLQHPSPRIDLGEILQTCAHALIDISDGLSADLNHICHASGVGACLFSDAIPIHPLVKKYHPMEALQLALSGGDDYELCFTVPPAKEKKLLALLGEIGLSCYEIGIVEAQKGLRLRTSDGQQKPLIPQGYNHFS